MPPMFPAICVPIDQRDAVQRQQALADATLAFCLSKLPPLLSGVVPSITVVPNGMWQSKRILGHTNWDTLDVAIPACGKDANEGTDPTIHGVPPALWANLVFHEICHVREFDVVGLGEPMRRNVERFPYEEIRPSWLAAVRFCSRAWFGNTAEPSPSQWPSLDVAGSGHVLTLASRVAEHAAPPAVVSVDAKGRRVVRVWSAAS